MRYFLINLLLSIFYVLPSWFLKIIWPLQRKKIRGEFLDYRSAVFIKIIGVFGYKIDTENFSDFERTRSNFSRLKIKISEDTPKKFTTKNTTEIFSKLMTSGTVNPLFAGIVLGSLLSSPQSENSEFDHEVTFEVEGSKINVNGKPLI